MYRNLNIPQPNLTDRKTNTFRTFKKQILTFFKSATFFAQGYIVQLTFI